MNLNKHLALSYLIILKSLKYQTGKVVLQSKFIKCIEPQQSQCQKLTPTFETFF